MLSSTTGDAHSKDIIEKVSGYPFYLVKALVECRSIEIVECAVKMEKAWRVDDGNSVKRG